MINFKENWYFTKYPSRLYPIKYIHFTHTYFESTLTFNLTHVEYFCILPVSFPLMGFFLIKKRSNYHLKKCLPCNVTHISQNLTLIISLFQIAPTDFKCT